jgi:hypothetical protein
MQQGVVFHDGTFGELKLNIFFMGITVILLQISLYEVLFADNGIRAV